jgi:hypothetical protein
MAHRRQFIPDIGEIILTKRRGNRNLSLRVGANGQVRIGMPHWVPFEVGLRFAKSKKDWLQKQMKLNEPKLLLEGSRIGKTHCLTYQQIVPWSNVLKVRVSGANITIQSSFDLTDPIVQEQAKKAGEQALKDEAEHFLPSRVSIIAKKHNLEYGQIRIRKLTSRWGSCSDQKKLTLSYFLIQLPCELIDYVLLHELAHTKFANHNAEFWTFMEERLPDLKSLKNRLKTYRPRLEPY